MKKGFHKNPSDFFWLMLFFSIILTILSGVTCCFFAFAPGMRCDLGTPGFEVEKCISDADSFLFTSSFLSIDLNKYFI